MATRTERDRQKSLQEKHQMILAQLLKDEDNKYCVDCDGKGPRWASWNLGVFLCIRCAGIHRNLGVHVTKVKSVNLDTWTGEQIAMMQEMGNSRARAVYEANLPDSFRRPQTDSGLEAFIRAKYEQKKYIAREWIPPQPKALKNVMEPAVPVNEIKEKNIIEEPKKEKKKSRPKPSTALQLSNPPGKLDVGSKQQNGPVATKETSKTEPVKEAETGTVDLLGLDTPSVTADANTNDLFGDFMGNCSCPTDSLPPGTQSSTDPQTVPNAESGQVPSTENDVNLFGESSESVQQRKSTKEDILKLYGSASNQQSMFGVPGGMYMPQQQMAMAGGMPNGMMGGNMMQGNVMPIQGVNMSGMQPQMMAGQQPVVGVPQGAGMMNTAGQGMPMQGGANVYNMAGMYNLQQQQQHQLQQVQNQMAAVNLNGPMMGGFQPAGTVSAGANGWGAQNTGHTLSNNLWQ